MSSLDDNSRVLIESDIVSTLSQVDRNNAYLKDRNDKSIETEVSVVEFSSGI
jgi:hypothetical protein